MPPYVMESIAIALVTGAVVFGIGAPLARALASRIMHGPVPRPGDRALDDPRVEVLADEVRILQGQLEQVQDRLDFAERMLARQRDREALPGGS